jgi:DNA modification methylase
MPATLIGHTSADMHEIADQSAQLVFASPPFFDNDTEQYLRRPTKQQSDAHSIWLKIKHLADKQTSNFREIKRILHKSGSFVLHSKDIRYGGQLLPLTGYYEDLLRSLGFKITTRVVWSATHNESAVPSDSALPNRIGSYRAPDLEYFSVLRKTLRSGAPGLCGIPSEELGRISQEPCWVTERETHRGRHPHACPPLVLERLVRLFSTEGGIVVDAYCGGGGLIAIASRLGRDAVGYDIDPAAIMIAQRRISQHD